VEAEWLAEAATLRSALWLYSAVSGFGAFTTLSAIGLLEAALTAVPAAAFGLPLASASAACDFQNASEIKGDT